MDTVAHIVLDGIGVPRTNVRVELKIPLAADILGQTTDVRQSQIDVDVAHLCAHRDVDDGADDS